MAVLLSDVAKQSNVPLQKGIIQTLLRYSDLMALVPFETATALDNVVVQWDELPTVAFRNINEGYSESTGKTSQLYESLKGFGGDVDIDKVFDKIANYIEHPRVTQTKMKLKSMAYQFNNYFINGSPTFDKKGFYGLKWRVDQLPSRQKVCIGTEGTPFDVTASSANEHTFLDNLHRLIALVGGPDVILCNWEMRLGVSKVLRRMGLLDVTRDQFDREVETFNGAPITDVGLLADQSTEIIPDTEDPGDGGSDTTSIYAIRFGTDEALTGIQLNDLEAYWVGGEEHELESKPVRRLRIDWWAGLAGFGKYYAARMYNLMPAVDWT